MNLGDQPYTNHTNVLSLTKDSDPKNSSGGYIGLIKSDLPKTTALSFLRQERCYTENNQSKAQGTIYKRSSSMQSNSECQKPKTEKYFKHDRRTSKSPEEKIHNSNLYCKPQSYKLLENIERSQEAALLKKYDQYSEQTEKKFKERINIIGNYIKLDSFQPLSVEKTTRSEFVGLIRQNSHKLSQIRNVKYIEIGGNRMTEVVSLLEQDRQVDEIHQHHQDFYTDDKNKILERDELKRNSVNAVVLIQSDFSKCPPLTQLLGSFQKNFPDLQSSQLSILNGSYEPNHKKIRRIPKRSILLSDFTNQSEFIATVINNEKTSTQPQNGVMGIQLQRSVVQEIAQEFNKSQYLINKKIGQHNRYTKLVKSQSTSPNKQDTQGLNYSPDQTPKIESQISNFEWMLQSFRKGMIEKINPQANKMPIPLIHTDSLKSVKEKFNLLKVRECERMGLIQRKVRISEGKNSILITQIKGQKPLNNITQDSSLDSHIFDD